MRQSGRPTTAGLLALLDTREKAALCSGQDFWQTHPVERLGIPSAFLADGPHGLRKPEGDPRQANIRGLPATCFPTASALANSWDRSLLQEIGVALGAECRALGVAMLLGPGINIKRSPLCGRNFEYFSEDPLLGGELAAAWIDGLQSLGIAACVKHFAANNQETRRMVIDARVDDRTLREIYLRGFEIAVRRARPAAVMAAYNRLNGVYCSENPWLIDDVLRGEWGFSGLVVSDWGAVNDRVAGLIAGLDLEMPASGGVNEARILAAVDNGALPAAVLDRTAGRILDFVLGSRAVLTDPVPVDFDAHHAIARRAAAAGAVLLKNEGGILPLRADQRIALIGEFAAQPRYQGTGSSQITPTRLDTALSAFRSLGIETEYAAGYAREQKQPEDTLIAEACSAAARAEVAVIFAGLPESLECEAVDRMHLRLPAAQEALIRRVASVNPRTVVVLSCGAPVETPWIDDVPALFAGYLGGQGGGSAIAELLLGIAEPAGRLAESWPRTLADVPSSACFPGNAQQVDYVEGLAVGYRHFAETPESVRFAFGHGLSYTRFAFEAAELSRTRIAAGESLEVRVSVRNTGTRHGTETVQVYISGPGAAIPRPSLELRAFARLPLAPGESGRVSLRLDERAFAVWDTARGDWGFEPGTHRVSIGASSADIRLRCSLEIDVPESLRMRRDSGRGESVITPDPLPAGFHINSLLGELRATWLGALLYHATVFGSRRMARRSGDRVLEDAMVRIAAEMPLRQLVAFSGGAIDFAMADALLTIMNGRTFAGLRQLFRASRARRPGPAGAASTGGA